MGNREKAREEVILIFSEKEDNEHMNWWEIIQITWLASLVSVLATKLTEHFLVKDRDFEHRQWEIKRDVCIDALSAIDAFFSHTEWTWVTKQPTKQKLDISKIRECHSKLILACENVEIPQKFIEILLPSGDSSVSPTESLNEFRNLIRNELKFGTNILSLDQKRAWIWGLKGDTE
jgi:hypothetical protein